MEYSKLSDFEINKLVGSALGKELMPDDCQDLGLSGFSEVMLRNGDFKDYCNDPADAWPIMTENRIAIIPDTAAGEWVAFNEFTLYEGDWMFASDPAHHSNGKNPLRCAMETFLMMQESRHA